MPRAEDIPGCPTKPSPTSAGEHGYQIELITPMFGGGVKPRVNDPSFPIRPTAIRGQLQFWWRATVGAQYETLRELRVAQSEVWGSTERASRVQVGVENPHVGEPAPCARFEADRNNPSKFRSMPSWNSPFNNTSLPYALFPFQGQLADGRRQIEAEPASCVTTASFRLILRCPDNLWPQVEPALWAWVNFGGLGCRTRRGCGAIRCKDFSPGNATDAEEVLTQRVPRYSVVRDWPTIADNVLVRTCDPPGDPVQVWDWTIGLFKYFRQGENFARDTGPGRSRYPEPETIRKIKYDPANPWRHGRLSHIPNDAFPRAELGLPIVFHFKPPNEPPDTVLYPSNSANGQRRERMASPLILKPLALANGKAIPLILRLKAPPLTGVDLREGDISLTLPPSAVIRGAALATYKDSPVAAPPNGSALEAFVELALLEGFTKVI
jgi:CRISPR-associated protein Cmr1